MKKQIGWFNLTQDTTFRNTFEFAAWYEEMTVKAGRYPIEVMDYYEEKDGQVGGHIRSAYITMPGIIKNDYFAAHFCGMPINDYDTSKNAGEEVTHTTQIYLYELAHQILKGETEYELLPEYEAKEVKFISWFDNEEKTTTGIFKKNC